MLSKRARLWLGLIAAISLLSVASSCSKTPDDVDDGPTDATKKYVKTGKEGTITGVITYNGAAPEPKKIDTAADPACAAKAANLMTEEWAVKDGKVANTFLYIKEGTLADGTKISAWGFDSPTTPVAIDQNGCSYKPHVSGVMVKQPISITNSDPTTHNVHFTPKNNPDWNQSQPNGAGALTHKLNAPEVSPSLVAVKCNQHPWMKSYMGVLKHPFFAVSAADGTYTIKDVPPGKYTLVAWHEGGAAGTEKTIEVTVAASAAAKADFSYGATAMGQPSSLQVLPAIEIPMLRR